MGRAQARPLFLSLFAGRPEQLRISQGPQGWQDARQPTDASPRQTSTSLSTAHPARPRTQAGPVLLLADWEACAARRDGSDAAHPGGRFSLAGRA